MAVLGSVCLSDEVVTSPERGSEAQQWRLSEASQRMMVARVTLTLCAALMSLAAANLEFKHHNNTELAAILQQVRTIRIMKSRNIEQNLELKLSGEERVQPTVTAVGAWRRKILCFQSKI